MNIKSLLLLLFFFSIVLFVPKTTRAFDLKQALTSEVPIVVKIQEGIEYFFAFRIGNKVTVLEKHAEKRLVMAQGYVEEGNNEKVQNLLQSYLQIKDRQNDLLDKDNDEGLLKEVENRTIEQQKTMEGIKGKIDVGEQGKIIQVQEQVVNQVAKRIIDVNGTEGQTEFLNEVLHVWAPGTGPGGGEAGVVYEGGGKLIFAPGTGSGGGTSGVVIEGGQMMFAPGTSAGGSGGTTVVEGGSQNIDPGTTQGGTSGDTIVDPDGAETNILAP